MMQNVVRARHHDVHGDAQARQCTINARRLGPRRCNLVFHDQEVKIAIRCGITARLGAEQDNPLRIADGYNAADDLTELWVACLIHLSVSSDISYQSE